MLAEVTLLGVEGAATAPKQRTREPRESRDRGKVMRFLCAVAAIWLVAAVADGLVWINTWGHRGQPIFHPLIVTIFAFVGGLIYSIWGELAEHYPVRMFRLSMWPPWTSFESTFRYSRWYINLVVFSYALFYLTQGLAAGSDWARWVNENILNFVFMGHQYRAVDVLRFEVYGFILYLAAELIYNLFCPQILKHSAREKGLPKTDAPLIFVETIERHGAKIPPNDLYRSVNQFVSDHDDVFSEKARATVRSRLASLAKLIAAPSEGDEKRTWEQMSVGSVASVARLFPSSLGIQIYYLGKSLFDALYPVHRVAVRLLLWAALVLTSLPVLAKLLGVVAPRLVEMNMLNLENVPPLFRDSEWVLFWGKIQHADGIERWLVPDDDPAITLVANMSDVTELRDRDGTERIFLRIGAELARITINPNISRRPSTPVNPNRMTKACPSEPTMCSGGAEICCNSRKVAGTCYGSWSCP
jgi:hypothetical protein